MLDKLEMLKSSIRESSKKNLTRIMFHSWTKPKPPQLCKPRLRETEAGTCEKLSTSAISKNTPAAGFQ